MLFDKYFGGGGISSNDAHSNQYGAGTESEQTFSQRKEIEQNRNHIAGYQQSKIGNNFAPRDVSLRSKPRHYKMPVRKVSRQEMNARPQAFREPPTRKYNPYA